MEKISKAVQETEKAVVSMRRKSYLRERGIEPRQEIQLDLLFGGMIHDNERFIPNDYARSALFTARNKGEPRRLLQNAPVYHLHQEISIQYTGIELRAMDDELVWMQILYYGATRAKLGEPFTFAVGELVQDIGWHRVGYYYDKARECISRLKASEIQISNGKAYGVGLAQSLIKHYEFRNDEKGKPQQYKVWLDRDLIYLLAGNTFTNHNWQKYRQYSPIARRLVDYIGSHREPYPLALDNFAKMCDSLCKTKGKWKQQVEAACEEVQAGEEMRVFVNRGKIHAARK